MESSAQTPASDAASPSPWEGVLLEHLVAIERFAARLARASGMRSAEVEDFVGSVRLKLVDGDYSVLRQHRGESSLRGYLKMVVSNLLRDERNRILGKYRPSVVATRDSAEAVQLDRFLRRDGFELETAIRMVRERHPRGRSVESLRQLANRLPEHTSRRFVSDDALLQRGEAGDAHERLAVGEQLPVHQQVEAALGEALAGLGDQDRLILELIFRRGLPISKIAKLLKLKQRSLYSRRDRSLKTLRQALQERGLSLANIRDVLGWDLSLDWGNVEAGPSPEGEREATEASTGPEDAP